MAPPFCRAPGIGRCGQRHPGTASSRGLGWGYPGWLVLSIPEGRLGAHWAARVVAWAGRPASFPGSRSVLQWRQEEEFGHAPVC